MAGRVGDTIGQLAQALILHQRAGRLAGEAVTLANLGAAYAERGRDTPDAGSLAHTKRLLDQALTMHRAIGDPRNEAETLRLLAEVHRDLDDLAPAATLALTALGPAEQTGDPRTVIYALSTIGTVQTRLSNGTAGLAYHARAQALLDQADSYVVLGGSEAAFFAAHDALLIGQQTGFALFERRATRAGPRSAMGHRQYAHRPSGAPFVIVVTNAESPGGWRGASTADDIAAQVRGRTPHVTSSSVIPQDRARVTRWARHAGVMS